MQEIVFTSENDANNVRDALLKLLDQYKEVTVADYYELVGKSTVYLNTRVGWTELKDISIGRTKDGGFVLDLPEPKRLYVSSAFPFLKGWWIVVDVPGDQTYAGTLSDVIGETMIIETKPNVRHGVNLHDVLKIDAYRERPTHPYLTYI